MRETLRCRREQTSKRERERGEGEIDTGPRKPPYYCRTTEERQDKTKTKDKDKDLIVSSRM